ncbi:MAG: glycosyltransferase family 4 protein [Candidatus Omnitrophica bacterium]|nr:glycosyltransferase family 4 protein [Candidatus Omnitrophota bacterium]
MKVLIVNRYMGIYGGAEQLVKELSCNLRQRGVKNIVATLNVSDEVREKIKGTYVVTPDIDFSYAFRSSSLVSSLGIFKEAYYLRQLVKKYYREFDLINIHNFPANWVAGNLGKPVVWMCNEIPDFYNNPNPSALVRLARALGIQIDKYMVNKSVDIVCVADRLNADAVFNRYNRKSFIVPYGIDAPFNFEILQSQREDLYRRYGLSAQDFIVLQVGVVCPTKNQEESVKALLRLKGYMPEIKLLLAGNDKNPYADSLKKFIKELGLEDRVIFTGLVSQREVWQLYSICNLCVFPVKLQGGYLSVFEALCFGVPVIAYPTMGASTLVQDESLGIVSRDLVSSIKDIRENYSSYKEKSRKAGLWVRENLTWPKFTQNMLEIFKKVCGQDK